MGGGVEGLLPRILFPIGFGCERARRMEGERLRCFQLWSQLCRGGHRAVGSPKPFLIRTSSGTMTDGTRSLSPSPPWVPPVSAIGSTTRILLNPDRGKAGSCQRWPWDTVCHRDGDISRRRVSSGGCLSCCEKAQSCRTDRGRLPSLCRDASTL